MRARVSGSAAITEGCSPLEHVTSLTTRHPNCEVTSAEQRPLLLLQSLGDHEAVGKDRGWMPGRGRRKGQITRTTSKGDKQARRGAECKQRDIMLPSRTSQRNLAALRIRNITKCRAAIMDEIKMAVKKRSVRFHRSVSACFELGFVIRTGN